MNTNDSALYGIEYEELSAIESKGDGSSQAAGDARGVTYAISGSRTVDWLKGKKCAQYVA